jgi:hypothetical protein
MTDERAAQFAVLEAAREWHSARVMAIIKITGDGSGATYMGRLAKAETELSRAVMNLVAAEAKAHE